VDLSERMKEFEALEAGRRFMRGLPILARIDGRCFSRFTADLAKPFDVRFARCMIAATEHLVREFKPVLGYTQSDEITLLFHEESMESQVVFDGRIAKMTSILAAAATARFAAELPAAGLEGKLAELPLFDCRVWQVPSREEAANVFLWRELDASRNSVQMAAHAAFGHEALDGLDAKQMQEKLFREKGVNWNDFADHFKRGTYVRRVTVARTLSAEQLARIPEQHRPAADTSVQRYEIRTFHSPPLSRVANRVQVILEGREPVMRRSHEDAETA
jgi:tRNA(His) guanylyltransferase